MTHWVERAGLMIGRELADLVEKEIAPGTAVDTARLWEGYAAMLAELAPRNRQLLVRRDDLQQQIHTWHALRRGAPIDGADYRKFLEAIGYIVPQGAPFVIETENVDSEIAEVAGPQLVVPVMNARFALNAANARWGSLYDALYGTDAIEKTGELAVGEGYNARRGAAVVARAAAFLDTAIPLAVGRHADVTAYDVRDGELDVTLRDGTETTLADPSQFVGTARDGDTTRLLTVHHGLHLELVFDPSSPVGKASASGLSDVVVEAALTTIQDCEDSVAAVDVHDKVVVYRNWLGLMKGDLAERVTKNGQTFTRRLAPDRAYTTPTGQHLVLPGRSLMLVRNVGHLMTTDAVLTADGRETPEGMLDALVTGFCALHDLRKTEGPRNSRSGSIYIVKPKMHGPEEVAFTNDLFDAVEDLLGLPRYTIKVGIMDEERRTSINLAECIRAARHRLVFINTGFLDRTGDEIHTSMEAGPVLPKAQIRDAVWLGAYEDNNVDQGLKLGLVGTAQIGKGMWARPDDMAAMLATKSGHPASGASTAWVPSPTAATLHAMHYHDILVADVQHRLAGQARASIADLLTPPLLGGVNLSGNDVARELDNNVQSILGYVVRWIDQGIGCSKVPDIDDVALMEDRATLRISSQHIANWLRHGIVSPEQVRSSLERMAVVVDAQNQGDRLYCPMAPDFDRSLAFEAALSLLMDGRVQPNGYTEPILHRYRRLAKAVA